MLRTGALVCTFVCLFVCFVRVCVLGDALAQVAAMCRDLPSTPYGTPVEDRIDLDDKEEDGAHVWYYDVKPALASGTSIGAREGRKWYAVRKGREVGIFDTRETCKTHMHGYRGSEFKSFRKLSKLTLFAAEKLGNAQTSHTIFSLPMTFLVVEA